jgi:hypothetical protein
VSAVGNEAIHSRLIYPGNIVSTVIEHDQSVLALEFLDNTLVNFCQSFRVQLVIDGYAFAVYPLPPDGLFVERRRHNDDLFEYTSQTCL